jgi:hypothetical protein
MPVVVASKDSLTIIRALHVGLKFPAEVLVQEPAAATTRGLRKGSVLKY